MKKAHPPSPRFLLSHPAHLVALGFGSGLAPVAPGTWGTLWAWLAWVVLQLWLPPALLGWVVLGAVLLGFWACSVTATDLGLSDPSSVVWDEVAAFWLVLWLVTPAGWLAQLAAFGLFRFFDAVKPGPVGWADRRFGGGFGIMVDDLVAASCTLLVIAFWRRLW